MFVYKNYNLIFLIFIDVLNEKIISCTALLNIEQQISCYHRSTLFYLQSSEECERVVE